VSAIRTNAAAGHARRQPEHPAQLGAPLRLPPRRGAAGRHRQFELAEIESLRQALEETHNVSSAISIARSAGPGPSSHVRLKSLLTRFDESPPTGC
jgi:hypothetical protein